MFLFTAKAVGQSPRMLYNTMNRRFCGAAHRAGLKCSLLHFKREIVLFLPKTKGCYAFLRGSLLSLVMDLLLVAEQCPAFTEID